MAKITPVTKTIGQDIDAAVANLHSRVTALEASALADKDKAVAWLKAQWPHLVTWVGGVLTALKVFGKL